jgi:hypothetical protein
MNGDALTMSQAAARHFFIGFGTGRYRNLPQSGQLPRVTDDIRTMREEWSMNS